MDKGALDVMRDATRENFVVLGRTVGTASGFDLDDGYLVLYDFEPAPGVPWPTTPCLSIQYSTGAVQAFDDDGNSVGHELDAIKTLADVPIAPRKTVN